MRSGAVCLDLSSLNWNYTRDETLHTLLRPDIFIHLKLPSLRTWVNQVLQPLQTVNHQHHPSRLLDLPEKKPIMCDWEEFIFGCACSYTKRKSYCHFARNDPNHQCFGVQVLKKVWDVPEPCDRCAASNRAAMQTTNGWSNGQYVAQESSEPPVPIRFVDLRGLTTYLSRPTPSSVGQH